MPIWYTIELSFFLELIYNSRYTPTFVFLVSPQDLFFNSSWMFSSDIVTNLDLALAGAITGMSSISVVSFTTSSSSRNSALLSAQRSADELVDVTWTNRTNSATAFFLLRHVSCEARNIARESGTFDWGIFTWVEHMHIITANNSKI